jgi:hypothetical protein
MITPIDKKKVIIQPDLTNFNLTDTYINNANEDQKTVKEGNPCT